MKCWFGVAVAVALTLLSQVEAGAASPTQELKRFFGAAAQVLDPGTPDTLEERLSSIRALVRDIVDFPGAAQLSLGPDWQARTPVEREEFVRLFADLLERSLIVGIAGRIHLPDGVSVRYVDEAIDGATATVWTTVKSRTGLDLPFDYRMVERGGRWAVRDVVIDGVSLAANYRAQFLHVIRSSSYAELLRQIRARVSPGSLPLVASTVAAERSIVLVTPASGSTELPRQPMIDSTPPSVALEAPAPRKDSDAVTEIEPVRPASSESSNEATGKEALAPAPLARTESALPYTPDSTVKAVPVLVRRTSGKTWWVQVGAFRNVDAARRLASALIEQESTVPRGARVIVEPGTADTAFTRVRIGPFSDRSAAATKLREVQSRGYDPFIAEQRD